MNTQFRKGVIEMCVLALIERKDMYGYEIVQSIAYYTEINEGTVYAIDAGGIFCDLFKRKHRRSG
jgi:PadR family transcriptional regulator PadR